MPELPVNPPHNQRRLKEITAILVKHNIVAGITPEKLSAMLQDLGPTFVKIGQMMSMQPVLPPAYMHELAKLRVHVTPLSFKAVAQILDEEYGENWRDTFIRLEDQPLGSASIAQVHLAYLKDGRKVVLKIQRPGIYETMAADIALLKKAVRLLRYAPVGQALDLQMLLDELWTVTQQEMDFLAEAENAREFKRNNAAVTYVDCPQIIGEYSTARVLVMEYITGWRIDDSSALAEAGYDGEEIAHKLAHNYVKQVVVDGFFHADPHTGNIIIREGQIVYIDLGMMGRLSAQDREWLMQAIGAIASHDMLALRDALLGIGRFHGELDQNAFAQDVENLLRRFGGEDFSAMSMGELWEALEYVLNKYHIRVPKGLSTLGRSMITFQGTLRTISEDINLMQVLAEFIAGDFLSNINVKKELRQVLTSLAFSFKKSLDIPSQLSDALKLLSRGEANVKLELTMSRQMHLKLNSMINRLVVAIVIAGLLPSSCLLCTTSMRPMILGIPALGFIGFVTSFLLGVWLAVSILFGRRK